MPKIRQTVADDLAKSFIPLERDADRVAAAAARCVAVAMDAAGRAALTPTRSNEAIDLILRAANASAEARRLVREAHTALAELGRELDLDVAYGDCDEGRKVFGLPLISAA